MDDPAGKSEPRRAKNPVRLERSGGIATIVIDNPPVNALGTAVRQGIFVALDLAEADESTKAILIAANGRTFPAGADITEFDQPAQPPELGKLCDRIEACSKPVLAALHGTVLGGGLEVAMSAHYRIAAPSTKLGLPEVKLGILPGAGGTQRTPRLVGIEHAYGLIQSGTPISASRALSIGLIDAVDEDPRGAARALAESGMDVRRTQDNRSKLSNAHEDMVLLQELRAGLDQMPGPQPATARIIDCVEGALLLPFEIGCARERDAFAECVASRDSQALRHLFLSTRKAAKFPELQGATANTPEQVAIVGGGLMGAGIALACLRAGIATTVVEDGEAGVTAALDRIGAALQRSIAKGTLSEDAGAHALTQLNLTSRITDISTADIVVETVSEDLNAKRVVLEQIGRHAKDGAVIATNSSYLDPAALAEATGRPNHFVNIHFFAPAQIMPLVEIGVAPDTHPTAVATTHALAKKLRKTPVRSAATPGLIVNRILMRLRLVADAMLEDGATPKQIDQAMRGFGFPLGPYEVLDRSGLDISYTARQRQPRDASQRYVDIGDIMVNRGWLGRKAGRGYYIYDEDRERPNTDLLAMLDELRAQRGIVPRRFKNQEIRDRIFLAIVNEAAVLLEQGVASRPSDIDVALVCGLAYPDKRGGPLHEADHDTLFAIAQRIEALEAEDTTLWRMAPLVKRLARERGKFSDLN